MADSIDYRSPVTQTGSFASEYPEGDPDDPQEARKYVRYVRALWDEQDVALRPLHETWMENLLFLANRQWFTRRNGRFIVEEVPSYKPQPIVNLCVPYFRTFLAKALKNRPAIQVVPASPDSEDIHAAELAEQILEAKWTELKISRILRRAVSWAIVTGNGYLYPYWNTSTGKMKRMEVRMDVPVYETGPDGEKYEMGTEEVLVPLDENGDPILGEDGRPRAGAEPYVVDIGDIGVRAYSPFHVRVDPSAEDDDDVRWFATADVMTLREIQEGWPEAFEGDMVPSSEDVGHLEEYSSILSTFAGESGSIPPSPIDQRNKDQPRALVIAFHELPSRDYPGGRYWVIGGGVLLEKPQELPEGVKLIHLQELMMPGRYHAASTMESVVRLNREYNEINSGIKEHHNLFIQGKWLNPRGSGITKTKMTKQPGEVITHNLGFEPKMLEIKPLPAAVYNERGRIMEDYQLVGGIHRVSMGAPPPGVTAGVAFLQLQEADDTDLGVFLTMLEESVASLGASFLRIIKARYTGERMVMVAGPNRRFQVRAFERADLAGAADVVPVAESSFPWSKTARQSMLLTMAQQMPDFFRDDETGQFDRANFARMLPIGGLDAFSASEDVDIAEALAEEAVFADYGTAGNQIPEVAWYQNHEVHYKTHRRMAVSGTFKRWPRQAQQVFLAHLEETRLKRDEARAQLNIANGGTPPGAQAPPGPGADPGQMMQQAAEGDIPVPGVPASPASQEQAEMIEELDAMRETGDA